MSRIRKALWVIPVFFLMACNLVSQAAAPQTQPPVQTQAIPVTAATDTLPAATDTAAPTVPPTQAPTDTATAFVPATLDPDTATTAAMMGSMGELMNIRQYFNPVGAPSKSWHNVPIMSQATAGQEFTPFVYSYIATATLDQARKFYAGKTSTMGFAGTVATGSSGSGSQAAHNVDFVSYALTIVLTSFDNDIGHVIVVISRAP
ncbi:MAG TPA: hypothetical protein VMC09_07700 [Anaerolineales bacterium]|nr:hypothetical protein [Anaerolineales bacterium]